MNKARPQYQSFESMLPVGEFKRAIIKATETGDPNRFWIIKVSLQEPEVTRSGNAKQGKFVEIKSAEGRAVGSRKMALAEGERLLAELRA